MSMVLNSVGFENVALHGMISQKERLAALAKFKSNTIKILLATDVASRGLDIPTVELVINHKVPKLAKEYIHRVGRTARAGRGGKAITLLSPYEIKALQDIEKMINTKLTEYKIDGNWSTFFFNLKSKCPQSKNSKKFQILGINIFFTSAFIRTLKYFSSLSYNPLIIKDREKEQHLIKKLNENDEDFLFKIIFQMICY